MNKKNNKLALNKQIVANLNEIKGGDGEEAIPSVDTICTSKGTVCHGISIFLCPVVVNWAASHLNDRCATDYCPSKASCFTMDNNCTQWGSCGKCG